MLIILRQILSKFKTWLNYFFRFQESPVFKHTIYEESRGPISSILTKAYMIQLILLKFKIKYRKLLL